MRRPFLVAASLLAAAPAHADHASFHGTLIGNVASTDNVFAQPRDTADADVYFQVRPGMLFAYDAPRMIQELTTEVEFLEYTLHSDKPSVTFRGGWKGFFITSPRSEVTVAANASSGQLNALSTRQSPDQSPLLVMPGGQIDTRQGDGSEYFSWQASKASRISQASFARWTATEDPNPAARVTTESYEIGGSLGFERSWRADTFGLEAGGSYLRLQRLDPNGVAMGSRLERQMNPRATAVWRHDVTKQWSVNADAGAVYINPVGTDPYNPTAMRRHALLPIFGGVVAYTEAWGRATLSARRAVTPNLFIAQNTQDDLVLAQLALPLPWLDDNPHMRQPKLVGLGSLGVERTQLIDSESGGLVGKFDVGRIDLGVAYTPQSGQTYGLRYEFVYQNGDAAATMITPSYYRNSLYFTFSLRYPDRVAASVPRRTQSVRSDRKDLAPVGAEPVVPDPSESLPEGDDGGGEGGGR